MKSLKENFLVKSVYAYLDLFNKAFPFFFILFYLPQTLMPTFLSKQNSLDVFGFFKFMDQTSAITMTQKVEIIGINLIIAVGIYLSLRRLTKFIKNTFEGNPYCEENGRHLKFVGLLVIIYSLLFNALLAFASWFKQDNLLTHATKIMIQIISLLSVFFNSYFVLGLFIIVLGEIILHGAAIKQENDLTV
jgi:hypothetical protein